MKRFLVFSAIALWLVAQVAAAHDLHSDFSLPRQGFYASLGGGFTYAPAQIVSRNLASHARIEYREAGNAFAAVGYRYKSLRADIQNIYSQANITSLTFPGATSASGKTHYNATLLNVYYDASNLSPYLSPYIGFGAGVANVKTNADSSQFERHVVVDTDVVAYQGIVGAQYHLTNRLSFTADYHFIETGAMRFNIQTLGTESHHLKQHLFDLGLIVRFA